MDVISGKLFSSHHQNMNHVHKDSKDLVYVIIDMENDISGGDTVFYDGVKISNLRSRSHILKKFTWKNDIWSIKKNHEGTLCRVHRAVISFILTRQIFLHFYSHEDRFYTRYINKTEKRILMKMVLGLNQELSYKEE